MQFICSPAYLKKQLATIAPVVGKNGVMPILQCVLVEIADHELCFTATDLETTIQLPVNAECSGQGKAAIPFDMLSKIVDAFTSDAPIEVSITFENGGGLAKIKQGKADYQIPVQAADDFPMPEKPVGNLQKVTLLFGLLRDALQKTQGFCSSDTLRPVMTGTLLSFANGMAAVATDAHRLSLVEYDEAGGFADEITGDKFNVILPAKLVSTILKQAYTDDDLITLSLTEGNNCIITFGYKDDQKSPTITCKTIEGRYPDYKVVIPQITGTTTVITMSKKEVADALKRLLVTAPPSTFEVNIDIKEGDTAVFSSNSVDYGTSGTESVEIENLGGSFDGDVQICFNGKFLVSLLAAIDAPKFNLFFFAPHRAAIFKPAALTTQTLLLMPIMRHK